VSGSAGPSAGQVSHLAAIRDELVARYTLGPRPAASLAATLADGPRPVVQDPDQRPAQSPAQGLAPAALGATAQVIQDPDQRPS
jgi:hypothetical protein